MKRCERCGLLFDPSRAFTRFCKPCAPLRRAETRKVSAAAWYARNADACRAANSAWHKANRDKRNAHDRAYFADRPELRRARNKATKHSRRGAPGAGVTRAELAEIMSHPCAYCGAPSTHLEHCTPLIRGGWHQADNLVSACASCNLRKGQKTVLEFLGLWPSLP